jgi:hypothetical protein
VLGGRRRCRRPTYEELVARDKASLEEFTDPPNPSKPSTSTWRRCDL